MGNLDDIELQENLLPNEGNKETPNTNFQHEVVYKGTTLIIPPKQWRNSIMVKGQILLCFYLFIIIGISDQTVGTLLPTLINHYDTKQTTITMLFILQFVGYSTSALSNDRIHKQLGRRGAILTGITCLIASFAINATMPHLVVFILMYFSYGLGVGLMDSCMNVLLSSLEDHNELMGIMHGFYGIGSIIGPPMVSHILERTATSRDSNDGTFGLHYFILFCMTFTALLFGVYLLKNETKLKYQYEISLDHKNDDFGDDHEDGFFQLIQNKMILLFSFYLFFYIGAEISIGSWLLSYLIHIKNLQQLEASYIVSWFWVGLTIGRMILGFITKAFKNEYRANLYYSMASLLAFLAYTIFTITITDDFTNTKPQVKFLNILLIVMSGIFIGPLFPTSNISLMKVLPVKLHVTGVGIMTSIGGTGSAIIPFLVGIIIEFTSFKFLPLYISFIIICYCLIWVSIPKLTTGMVKYDF